MVHGGRGKQSDRVWLIQVGQCCGREASVRPSAGLRGLRFDQHACRRVRRRDEVQGSLCNGIAVSWNFLGRCAQSRLGPAGTRPLGGRDLAVVEATVQRSRPVVLTALAAVLAFVPLTFSAFWGVAFRSGCSDETKKVDLLVFDDWCKGRLQVRRSPSKQSTLR